MVRWFVRFAPLVPLAPLLASGCTGLLGIDDPAPTLPPDGGGAPSDAESQEAAPYRGPADAVADAVTDAGMDPDAGNGPLPDAAFAPDGCAPLPTVPPSPPYTPIAKRSACSGAQVTSFTNFCGNLDWESPTCTAWFADSANNTCGTCIRPRDDAGTYLASGAIIYDQNGKPYANIAGCVEAVDGNTSCADPFQRTAICDMNACSSPACGAASFSELVHCIGAAGTGVCASYAGVSNTACQTDFSIGPLSSSGPCSALPGILTAICGNGT